MKTWKAALSLALCFVMAAGMLAGCASDTPEPAPAAPPAEAPAEAPAPAPDAPAEEPVAAPADAEPVTLRFSWWGTDPRHEATLAVIDAFTAMYPHITIIPEYGAQAGYNDNKMVEFASRNAPDMFQIETGAGKNYMNYGVLYNLSEAEREGWISFDRFDATYLENNGQFDTGSQWTIPTSMAGSAFVVNRELAEEIGIDFSQQYDWNQLLAWGELVNEYNAANGTRYYLLGTSLALIHPFVVRTWARQTNGAPIIDDDSKTLNMTEAQFRECFEFIDQLYRSGTIAPLSIKTAYDNADWEDPNWINGNYVAMASYTSQADSLADAADGFTCIPGRMPVMAGAQSDGWFANPAQYMGISAYTEHPRECAMFFDFFFNTEQAAEILGTVRSIPPTEFARDICAANGLASQLLVDVTNIAAEYNGKDDSGLTTHDEALNIMADIVGEIAYGRMSPEDAARAAVERLTAFLAEV